MAGGVNKVILVGNLGKDPEVRYSKDGKRVASFSVATTESWKNKSSGERESRTEWHRIVAFGDGLGEVVEKYLKKGSKVYVEGQLRTRKWQDQSGSDRYTTEVVISGFGGAMVMLDGAGGAGGGAGASAGGGGAMPPATEEPPAEGAAGASGASSASGGGASGSSAKEEPSQSPPDGGDDDIPF